MKKKSILALLLVLAIALSLLAGCNQGGGSSTLIVGASPVPHSEILEFIKEMMAEEGVELQIVEYTDYVQPNLATESGDVDANFFQHVPYMNNFNAEHGTTLVSVFPVHFEPLGLYKARTHSIAELQEGAIIAIPHDPTNSARALALLEATGLITLRDGAGVSATKLDIVDNQLNLDIQELEAAQIPHVLPDVDMAVINGNFALQAGLEMERDAVAAEDKSSLSAQTYANPIVVKSGNENDERILTLIRILNSSEVRDFINNKYEGRVVPVF